MSEDKHTYRPGASQSNDPTGESKPLPFPLHCLPPPGAEMARAICKTARVPESLAGCCVLTTVSSSIGAGLQVRSGPNRVTRGNIYALVSAESGSGKSEPFRHATQPLRHFEEQRVEQWRTNAMPSLLAEKVLLESEIKALTCGLQKVNAQLAAASPSSGALEVNMPAPKVATNNQ